MVQVGELNEHTAVTETALRTPKVQITMGITRKCRSIIVLQSINEQYLSKNTYFIIMNQRTALTTGLTGTAKKTELHLALLIDSIFIRKMSYVCSAQCNIMYV